MHSGHMLINLPRCIQDICLLIYRAHSNVHSGHMLINLPRTFKSQRGVVAAPYCFPVSNNTTGTCSISSFSLLLKYYQTIYNITRLLLYLFNDIYKNIKICEKVMCMHLIQLYWFKRSYNCNIVIPNLILTYLTFQKVKLWVI